MDPGEVQILFVSDDFTRIIDKMEFGQFSAPHGDMSYDFNLYYSARLHLKEVPEGLLEKPGLGGSQIQGQQSAELCLASSSQIYMTLEPVKFVSFETQLSIRL